MRVRIKAVEALKSHLDTERMKIHRRVLLGIALLMPGVVILHATQETIIVREARLFGERAIAQGFQCRTQIHPTQGQKFDVSFEMDKNLLYRIGIITGHGEKAVHPSRMTLVDQEKKTSPVEFQNTTFGSELKLHPLSTGQKTLKIEMAAKTTYSVVVCAHYASLYHTGEKDPVVNDHSHF